MESSRRFSVVSLGLVSALALVGCPSDPSVPANVALADLPHHLAGAVCDLYDRCNPFVATVYGEGAECTALLQARFEDSERAALEADVAAGSIVYHGDLVDDCIAMLAAAGCDVLDPLEVCEDIFEGTVDDGGACERNEVCGSDSYCAITTTCPGTCQARVASGGTCSGDSSCVSGLSCNGGTCTSPATAGAACNGTTGVACEGLAYACVGDDGATPGVCTAWTTLFRGAVGEPCDPRVEDFCDPELSCAFDGLSGTEPTFRCVARVAAGAACTIAMPDQCPSDQFCAGVDFDMGITMGTCMPLPTAGDDCTEALPIPRCAADHVCVTVAGGPGTCERLGRVGASCTSDAGCASGYCMGGTCVDGVSSICR